MQRWLFLGVSGVLCVACVTTGKYDAKVNELAQSVKREQRQAAEIARLKSELAETQASLDEMRKKYDTAATAIGELKERLSKLGQNVDQLASERGKLAAGLEDAEKRWRSCAVRSWLPRRGWRPSGTWWTSSAR